MAEKKMDRPEGSSSENNRKKQVIYYIILIICAIFIMLSTIAPWDSYYTMDSFFIWSFTGVFIPVRKTFTPLNWVWSDLLPFLSYMPLFSGIILVIGIIFYIMEYQYGKNLMITGAALGIVSYVLYPLIFWIIPTLMQAFGVGNITWLEGLRIPNEYGAYLCLISAIIAVPFSILVKMPELGREEEPEAFVIKEVAVPWKKSKPKKGEMFCSQCGAVIKEGTAFCNQCGTYF
ncbi:MAG: zinc ribbon domain-containing protein [Candidatus Helarchaeota archaeon]